MQKIKIISGNIIIEAELNDTPTAKKVIDALPIENSANTWGDEIYFEIPVESDLDDSALEVVEKGDICYWPSGSAICFFWGPTPVSKGDECRPASAVNVIGRIIGDPKLLEKISGGSLVVIEAEK